MKQCSLLLIYLTIFIKLAVGQENKTITIKGNIKDQKSKMPLVAQIKVIYNDNKYKIEETESKADGSFEIKTLPKPLILQAKTIGYIVSNIMMDVASLEMPNVITEVPLVLNQKSKINEVLLNFANKKNETEEKTKRNKQVFQAVDAIDGKSINAQFKLSSIDKSNQIVIKTTTESSVFDKNFTKKDTILVEVNADGYQKFLSVISINSFDETVHENTAKLIKSISFLNLFFKNEADLKNLNVVEINENQPKQVNLSKKGGIYFAILQTGISYKITANSNISKEISKEFTAKEGINQIVISLETKINHTQIEAKALPVADTKIVLVEKQTFKSEIKSISLEPQIIFFEQSSCNLNQESKGLLEQISKKMLELPETKIEITGHTDNVGDTRQNQYLSEFRAKVISNYLYNKGIKEHRIKIKGDGSKQPNSGNDTEDSRQKNRRAELRFY